MRVSQPREPKFRNWRCPLCEMKVKTIPLVQGSVLHEHPEQVNKARKVIEMVGE